MNELKPRRVQKMPFGSETRDSPAASAAVDVITHYGMTYRRKMNANLMGPPRVQMRTQQVSRSEAGKADKVRSRLPSTTDDCHPLSVSRVASKRFFDGKSVGGEVPPDHDCVPALYPSRRDGGAQ